ncbi:hypothetical protein [Kitasatospora sp. NBC_00458]|uniref:hypothetical protein n=1 Tax=Kitasatospora sp. NBC_00458 TaxID=2903568 RepID=UPI002E19126D
MDLPDDPPTTTPAADDQAMVRAGTAAVLDAEPDLTVVGESADSIRPGRHPSARTAPHRAGPRRTHPVHRPTRVHGRMAG